MRLRHHGLNAAPGLHEAGLGHLLAGRLGGLGPLLDLQHRIGGSENTKSDGKQPTGSTSDSNVRRVE